MIKAFRVTGRLFFLLPMKFQSWIFNNKINFIVKITFIGWFDFNNGMYYFITISVIYWPWNLILIFNLFVIKHLWFFNAIFYMC
jgi:hypothetical protein